MRYTWSKTESHADLATTVLNGGTGAAPIFAPTQPNVGTFNGKIENQTFTLALASSPDEGCRHARVLQLLQAQKRFDRGHLSAVRRSTAAGRAKACCSNTTKNNVGFDVYWRVARGQRIGFGYQHWDVDQNREDYDHHTDNVLFAEYKTTAIENVTARLKYEYLERRSNYLRGNSGVDANDPNFLERFVGRFDLANLNQNKVKLTVDWSPMPLFDLSLEAIYKDNDYRDYTIGRTKDRRDEIYGSVSYGDPAKLRFTLFGDVENIKYDSAHRNVGASPCNARRAGPNCYDPSSPPNSTAYNWSATNKDKNWTVGAGRRLAGDGPADGQGVGAVLQDRRHGRHGEPGQLRQPAADPRLRHHRDDVAQSEGDLQHQQELVGDGRLLVREVQVFRCPVQRLPVYDPVPGRHEQCVAELPQRLQRL